MPLKLDILVQKDLEEGGFVAIVPALPGCVSQGETMEELVVNIKEAIGQWLEAAQMQDERSDNLNTVEVIHLPFAFA